MHATVIHSATNAKPPKRLLQTGAMGQACVSALKSPVPILGLLRAKGTKIGSVAVCGGRLLAGLDNNGSPFSGLYNEDLHLPSSLLFEL